MTSWGERLTRISVEITDVKRVVVVVAVVVFECCGVAVRQQAMKRRMFECCGVAVRQQAMERLADV